MGASAIEVLKVPTPVVIDVVNEVTLVAPITFGLVIPTIEILAVRVDEAMIIPTFDVLVIPDGDMLAVVIDEMLFADSDVAASIVKPQVKTIARQTYTILVLLAAISEAGGWYRRILYEDCLEEIYSIN